MSYYKTYYRDFKRPTRKGVPDMSRVRAIDFAEVRSNLGHHVVSELLEDDKGYRIYFSPGWLYTDDAVEIPSGPRRL